MTILETLLAGIAGVLALVTIFWHDWIEALTGWDPDQHNGSFEIVIIVMLALVSLAVGLLARSSWRRYRLNEVAIGTS